MIESLLADFIAVALGVLITSQAWVLKQIHDMTVTLSGKHAEYDTLHRELVKDLDNLASRLERLERA